ncbi:hypothetical protein STSP2_00517 [Anaerohalosphaera lusitana]|uniref:Uncharacterized protein n=1 Tax=Anaerohalosphaera lusitana TaxID=1936003 RepID=A0A1U9NHH6_9BACT|nr:PEP-CTERM sorting domain-containing protein [Anaerohalosphaera lusitana]AQT67373.1 hypothetical protein STSP2_00517 [Anaerohalosphaera lusitana]
MKFKTLTLITFALFATTTASANLITGDGIPLIQYDSFSGLVLVDDDGANVTRIALDFHETTNEDTGLKSSKPQVDSVNSYSVRRVILDWPSLDFLSVLAEMLGFNEPLEAWAHISPDLVPEDFAGARYWVEGSTEEYQTDIHVVPEPATLALLTIGTLTLRRRH